MKYTGTEYGDAFFGTAVRDSLYGYAGGDILDGAGGADLIDGGDGDDLIFGGAGADVILGGAGSDDIYADVGDDNIKGGAGFDVLRADAGFDRLEGGAGDDILFGDAGVDVAVFSGNVADYDFFHSWGMLTLTDKRSEAEGGEGTDYILDVERLQFADEMVFLTPNKARAVADTLSTTEGATLQLDAVQGLLANDRDPERDAFSLTAVNGQAANVGETITLASGAQLTVQADGSIVFETLSAYDHLEAGQTATAKFTYTVTDAYGATATATATVQIAGQSDGAEAGDAARASFAVESDSFAGEALVFDATEAFDEAESFQSQWSDEALFAAYDDLQLTPGEVWL